ncbi:MAG TPA: sigma-70 family RNA polymerase sigma factor [Bryobacterales bacterium]|nr:sigma-70 family RNA polymerase sigma factor [Bryobacterales bacterium]
MAAATTTIRNLVNEAKAGDTDAFARLTSPLAGRLVSVATAVVGNRDDAEDVVQESLWKAMRRLRDYREEAAFSTWLTRITVNQAIGWLRRRNVRPEGHAVEGEDGPMQLLEALHAPEPSPEEVCRAGELHRLLRQAVEKVDPKYRVPFCKYALEELSYREIADELGVPVTTVKTRIHRARQMLRRALRRYGYAETG